METKLRIFRYNPETDQAPRYDEFPVEITKGKTILDCLEEIKANNDGTLTFDRSCKSGMCGGCGLRINGKGRLACQTQALHEVDNGIILIEPLSNFPIIKDLAVNKSSFWKKIKESEPCFVHKEFSEEDPAKMITKESLLIFENSDSCIMCGLCYSACSSVKHEPGFLGPAAATKAYRFLADPRDAKSKERLASLQQQKIWLCSHQYQCIEACPKNIEPGNLIFKLENKIFQTSKVSGSGMKNAKYFSASFKKYGKLDFRNWGIAAGRSFFKELILNLKLSMKSRISLLSMKKIKNYADIRKLMNRLGEK